MINDSIGDLKESIAEYPDCKSAKAFQELVYRCPRHALIERWCVSAVRNFNQSQIRFYRLHRGNGLQQTHKGIIGHIRANVI